MTEPKIFWLLTYRCPNPECDARHSNLCENLGEATAAAAAVALQGGGEMVLIQAQELGRAEVLPLFEDEPGEPGSAGEENNTGKRPTSIH